MGEKEARERFTKQKSPGKKIKIGYSKGCMNMFKSTKAQTVAEYLAAVPEERQELVQALHALIQQTVPDLKPYFAYNMIGYGAFPYITPKKEPSTWPIIALANQKQYVSVYVCAVDHKTYLAKKYAKELGKVSVGKSCIRIKKWQDVHLPTLRKVLLFAAKHPGLQAAE